ncbi:MFS transporter [Streptomyces sp. NPDC055506]
MTGKTKRPERITRGLIASSFIDSMGNGLFLAGSVLYLTRVVDLSNAQVTFGLTVAGLIGFLTTVPVSMIGDRIGAGRLLVILQFWRLAGFVAYAFVGGFVQFMVVVAFIALGDRVAQPVLQTVVGQAVGDERRVRTMAWIRSTRNAGLTAGALLTSLAVTADSPWSYRAIILGDAATFLASGLLLWALRLPGGRPADGAAPHLRPWTLLRSLAGERRYLSLTALNGLLSLHTTVLAVGVPLWVSQHTKLPAAGIPVLIAVNTILAVTLQPWAARGAVTLSRAARRSLFGGLALAAGALQFALAPAFGPVAAAVVLTTAMISLTLGEVWQSAGGWEISYALSPEDRRNTYLGVFSLGPTGAQILGPVVVVIGVVGGGPLGWVILAVTFATTGLAMMRATVTTDALDAHRPAPRRLRLKK